MKKEDLFDDFFLKQFKSGEEPSNFLKQLQKRGLEKMLEGELDSHLDYVKNKRSKADNSRNGYSQKKVRSSFGEDLINVPRDREGSFNPMIVPKRQNSVNNILTIHFHTGNSVPLLQPVRLKKPFSNQLL